MEHQWNRGSPRAFVFPHRVIVKDGGPVAQQLVPDESGQSFWEELEAPASVCAEILRLAERVKELGESSAHNAELAEKALRDRAGEGARIRRELLAEFGPHALITDKLGDNMQPLRTALDRVIPEEEP